jgi:hypothetical protein
VYACSTLLFSMAWQARAASTPSTCTYIGNNEISYTGTGIYHIYLMSSTRYDSNFKISNWIADDAERRQLEKDLSTDASPVASADKTSGSVWSVLLAPAALVVIFSHSAYNFGRYFIYSWMPNYFHESLQLDAQWAGVCLMAPELCGFIGTIVGGRAATRMVGRSGSDRKFDPAHSERRLRRVRKLFSFVGFFGAGAAMWTMAAVNTAEMSAVLLCAEGLRPASIATPGRLSSGTQNNCILL